MSMTVIVFFEIYMADLILNSTVAFVHIVNEYIKTVN